MPTVVALLKEYADVLLQARLRALGGNTGSAGYEGEQRDLCAYAFRP